MDQRVSDELKKLRNEKKDEIKSDAVCSLCNRKKGDPALIPINKLEISRSTILFVLHKTHLTWHSQEKQQSICMCDKCHYCYHHFSVLSEFALEEWREDSAFWKGV